MKITSVDVRKIDGAGKVLGFANITINECLVIKNFKIVEGQNGLFVGMPNEKAKNGEYYDTVFPITKDFRDDLTAKILEKF